jgi:hypothetical protein
MAERTFEQQIRRLQELEAKGAPPPWSMVESHGELRIESRAGIVARVNNYIERDRNGRTEGELTCLSRNLLPSLLVEREEMQRQIGLLDSDLAAMTKAHEIAAREREAMQKQLAQLATRVGAWSYALAKEPNQLVAIGVVADMQELLREMGVPLWGSGDFSTGGPDPW